MNHDVFIQKIKKTISDIEPEAEIILYGSRARESASQESDWDFIILVDGIVDDNRIDQIRHRLYEIEWENGEVVSAIVKNRNEWSSLPFISTPFYKNVSREGILL